MAYKETSGAKGTVSRKPEDRDRWRREIAQYAEKYGVSAAAREYDTTRKTVRLWLTRLRGELVTSGQDTGRSYGQNAAGVHKNMNVGKPYYQRTGLSAPACPDDKKRTSPIIQVGLLDLDSIWPGNRRNRRLPRWQISAREITSGGGWVGFLHEYSAAPAGRFLESLARHMMRAGVDPGSFDIVLDRSFAPLGGTDEKGPEGILHRAGHFFGKAAIDDLSGNMSKNHLAPFHRKMIEECYSTTGRTSVRKFLRTIHAYMLRFNYEKKAAHVPVYPPFQLFCRNINGYCRENIFDFSPEFYGKPNPRHVRRPSRLKNLAGLFRTMLGPASGSERPASSSKPQAASVVLRPAGPAPQNSRPGITAKTGEFIDLGGGVWKKTGAGSGTDRHLSGRRRDRREILNRALEMIAARENLDRLKEEMPVTDGELALIKRKLNMHDAMENIR